MTKRSLFFFFAIFMLFSLIHAQKNPDQYFGFSIGSDGKLVKYPDIIKYFKYIDEQSDRIKLVKEGESTLNNDIYMAIISSEKNLNEMDQLIKYNQRLANPDHLSESEAKQIMKKAKTFVLITCAIHATEIASTQLSMLLAHQLATTNNPDLEKYLENVVILLMPSINPDGNIMITDWYDKYLNTEFEGCRMPYLYHHYAGHDNNRDFYMLNLKETQVVNAVLHKRYFPHIYLDMHQMRNSGPRMFVPPFKDPLNHNLDPILLAETNIIGSLMALRLQEKNKKGVGSSYAFDAYWPGGSKNTAWYKNVVGVLTELASVRIASPIYIDENELKVSSKGLPEYKAQVNFPDPWPGGWWHLKDIIEYERIAAMALIEIASKNRYSFLNNFYKMGINSIKKAIDKGPFAYAIPFDQWDLLAAYSFLQRMEAHGVRIYQLEKDTLIENRVYRRGDFFIPLNQPYRNFIKVMMEKQQFPEIKHMKGGPIIEPYDAAGWTMPLQMGVRTNTINGKIDDLSLKQVNALAYPTEQITGDGKYYCIPARYNRSVIAINRLHRLKKKKVKIYRYLSGSEEKKWVFPGDYLINTSDISIQQMKDIIKDTGIHINRISINDIKSLKLLKSPKIAIYQSYRANIDEGWTRWVLDNFGFPFFIIHNKDFQNLLLEKYDVILFADMSRETLINGKSRSYWDSSDKSSPPEYRGGIGKKGIKMLIQFVKNGGTIILMDSASEIGITDFALPFSNILHDVKEDQFYCPGSLLKIKIDTLDPIGWGMEEENFIYFSKSSVFQTRIPTIKSMNRKVVARYNRTGPHLLSGYIKGEKILNRAVSIIRFDYYKGHVLVFGGRVQHRAQTFGTFKLLFNSIYYSVLEK